jgi:hypothetical protein
VPPQLVNTKIPTLQRAWLSYEHRIKPPLQQVKAMLPTSQSHAAKLVNR